MNCDAFVRWLDDGMPAAGTADAEEHARACADCADALAAARALEGLLAAPRPAATAPAGFTDRVMARVADVEARSARTAPTPSAFPWWVRAAAQPATVLAFVVAGLALRYANAIVAAGSRLAVAAMASMTAAPAATATAPSPFADPMTALGIGLAAFPLAAWAAWKLFTWSEHAVMARAPRPERFLV